MRWYIMLIMSCTNSCCSIQFYCRNKAVSVIYFTSEGRISCIFTCSEVQLSSHPGHNWHSWQPQDHLNFIIGHLGNIYTKREDNWTILRGQNGQFTIPLSLWGDWIQTSLTTLDKHLIQGPAAGVQAYNGGINVYKPLYWSRNPQNCIKMAKPCIFYL